MLKMVTLTGADDSIGGHAGLDKMIEISAEFPFVEWGILIGSGSSCSRERFPSASLFAKLAGRRSQFEAMKINLSLHLCGDVLRSMMDFGRLLLPTFVPWGMFQRVQLNWHGFGVPAVKWRNVIEALGELGRVMPGKFSEAIFQLDGVNDYLFESFDPEGQPGFVRPVLSGLFDRSHGAGVTPDKWPAPFENQTWCGFAGGLGPGNITEELERIAAVAGERPFWVDMETRLFTGRGEFCFGRCLSVLEQCRPLIG